MFESLGVHKSWVIGTMGAKGSVKDKNECGEGFHPHHFVILRCSHRRVRGDAAHTRFPVESIYFDLDRKGAKGAVDLEPSDHEKKQLINPSTYQLHDTRGL
jgi:hypothetical protein